MRLVDRSRAFGYISGVEIASGAVLIGRPLALVEIEVTQMEETRERLQAYRERIQSLGGYL